MSGKLRLKNNYLSNSYVEGAFQTMSFIPIQEYEGENEYKGKSWKELVSYFEDSEALLDMSIDEKTKLYNAVKDKILKEENGMEGFKVSLLPYMHDGTNGATSQLEGAIFVYDMMEDDLFSETLLPDMTNNRRFYGLNTLNTIIHETRHAIQMTKIKRWLNGEKDELNVPEIALLVSEVLEQIKKSPLNAYIKNQDIAYTKYLMSAYEFDARRYANKKILSFMIKGYIKDLDLASDYMNAIESEELADLNKGRVNQSIPKSIKFEVGLTKSYLNFFLKNFNCELFSDFKEILENFDTNEYLDTMVSEYERLKERLDDYACKFVDKCYKTSPLKRYAKIMQKTQEEGNYQLFGLCKLYLEKTVLAGEKEEQTESAFGDGKMHEYFKKVSSYLGENIREDTREYVKEEDIQEYFESLLDEKYSKLDEEYIKQNFSDEKEEEQGKTLKVEERVK